MDAAWVFDLPVTMQVRQNQVIKLKIKIDDLIKRLLAPAHESDQPLCSGLYMLIFTRILTRTEEAYDSVRFINSHKGIHSGK